MFYSMTYSGILQPWLSGVVYGGTKLNITQDDFWVNVIKFHRIIFGSRWFHDFRGGITQGSIEEHCKVNYKQASPRTRPQHVFCITWGLNTCKSVTDCVAWFQRPLIFIWRGVWRIFTKRRILRMKKKKSVLRIMEMNFGGMKPCQVQLHNLVLCRPK